MFDKLPDSNMPEILHLIFNDRKVESDTCSGPAGRFKKPQGVLLRLGKLREKRLDWKGREHEVDTRIEIFACTELRGTQCGRDSQNRHCVKPHVIESPQQ